MGISLDFEFSITVFSNVDSSNTLLIDNFLKGTGEFQQVYLGFPLWSNFTIIEHYSHNIFLIVSIGTDATVTNSLYASRQRVACARVRQIFHVGGKRYSA